MGEDGETVKENQGAEKVNEKSVHKRQADQLAREMLESINKLPPVH
jgi:hypothetical protein